MRRRTGWMAWGLRGFVGNSRDRGCVDRDAFRWRRTGGTGIDKGGDNPAPGESGMRAVPGRTLAATCAVRGRGWRCLAAARPATRPHERSIRTDRHALPALLLARAHGEWRVRA